MALVKYTAVKLLHKSNVWVPTDTSESVAPLLAPCIYRISRPIKRTVIFSLEILEKNNDECTLILVIYWKKTGLLHIKISNHNIIYSS
jgi:hypothetical protein